MKKRKGLSFILALLMILTLAVPVTTQAASVPSVYYRTQIQKIGWDCGKSVSTWKKNGAKSGTTGNSLRLEAIQIYIPGVTVYYRTHIQKLGWEGSSSNLSTWKKNGEISGTVGKSLRLEAIQIKLDSASAKKYDIYYRVHAQNVGWMGWAKNGATAGTSGYSRRLESIQIKLVAKGSAAPGSTSNTYKTLTASEVNTALQAKAKSLIAASGTSSKSKTVYMDINGDGWNEGIVYNWNNLTVSLIGYNRVTGKAVVIKTLSESGKWADLYALYSTSNHLFGSLSYSTGGAYYEVYTISGTTAKLKITAETVNGKYTTSGSAEYYLSGKKVTSSTLNSKMKALGLTLGAYSWSGTYRTLTMTSFG